MLSQSINQSKVLTKPYTDKEKPHPSTTTEGSKPCHEVTQVWGAANESQQHLACAIILRDDDRAGRRGELVVKY